MKDSVFNRAILRNSWTLVLVVCLLMALPAIAQSGGDYILTWSTIGGGGTSAGGSYSLMVVIGRPEAGWMSGGDYELVGGFLPGPENNPPVANAGPDQTVEQESYAGTEVTLDGSGSADPDSTPGTNDDIVSFDWFEVETFLASGETINYTFPLSSHTATLVVTDSYGQTDDDEVTIIVQDTTTPTINSLSADPSVLWPPNHKMVEVTVTVDAVDICDPAHVCQIVDVTSNEPINGLGDGDTEPDWEITSDLTVNLRAEHAGVGTGRLYTIYIECTDASGNTATATVEVTVPHDQDKGKAKK